MVELVKSNEGEKKDDDKKFFLSYVYQVFSFTFMIAMVMVMVIVMVMVVFYLTLYLKGTHIIYKPPPFVG